MAIRTREGRLVMFFAAMVTFWAVCGTAAADIAEPVELRVISASQGWGILGINQAAHAPGQAGAGLQIKDKRYDLGIGVHARSEILVDLNGSYSSFDADIGVQWQGGASGGSVVFEVYVDGEKKFDSGTVKEADGPRTVNVPVAGAKELLLVVTDAGDGFTGDSANWAEARITRAPGVWRDTERSFDIAPFARVVVSDANCKGSYPSRTEEMKAEEIFLETEIAPDAEGNYTVPVTAGKQTCVGLNWVERRRVRKVVVTFAKGTALPDINTSSVQWWVGESLWQGNWKELTGKVEPTKKKPNRWIFMVNPQDRANCPLGVEKVRWVFAPTEKALVISKIEAFSQARWDVTELKVEMENPVKGKKCQIGTYNGQILAPAPEKKTGIYQWDVFKPARLKLQYCKSTQKTLKSDRTLLNFKFADAAFSVSVDDVLENGCVYVKDFGLFVSAESAKITLDEYKQTIAGRETVLARVRQSPDQSFGQAMEKVHRPIQDNGPTLLSLAGDNQKFVVEQNGSITYRKDDISADMKAAKEVFKLVPTLGTGKDKRPARKLYGQWLPIIVNTVQEEGVTYSQRSFVAPFGRVNSDVHPWLARRGLCCAEFGVENGQTTAADANLRLFFSGDVKGQKAAEVREVEGGFIVAEAEGKLLAIVDATCLTALKINIEGGQLIVSGRVPGQMTERLNVYIPGWEMAAEQWSELREPGNLLADTEAYWNRIIGAATLVEVPEPLLANVIRASQVHCLIATRNEEDGKRFVPWIASISYGPLESETHSVIRGMGLLGYEDFARRSLDFFISKYNEKGYLTTGYTVMGHGWHLWTLAEYYQRSADKEWLKGVAPQVEKACRWIVSQREKTKRTDAAGQKLPEYGLMPPGVAADWNRFGYRSYLQGNFYAGLNEAAGALADINYPSAQELAANAAEFRQDIQRSYAWTQAHSPVLSLGDGTWVPYYPAFIYCFGTTEFMFPGEDGTRSWIYDVELGSHHFGVLGVLDPTDRNIDWMINRMEDVWFFHDGLGEYWGGETIKDWFNLGGFSKVQPYYTRIQELYALRDEVKPFIRSYFNSLPTLLNTENLSLWEHFHNQGAWNKTHETGWFLVQSRTMMVTERGDELWLAPFVTNHWTKPGMVVAMKNAPTEFGPVSYKITSCVDKGYIEATIEPPTRKQPKAIVIRLRHPEQKAMRAVIVNGASHTDFNAEREYVRIADVSGPITVKAEY